MNKNAALGIAIIVVGVTASVYYGWAIYDKWYDERMALIKSTYAEHGISFPAFDVMTPDERKDYAIRHFGEDAFYSYRADFNSKANDFGWNLSSTIIIGGIVGSVMVGVFVIISNPIKEVWKEK